MQWWVVPGVGGMGGGAYLGTYPWYGSGPSLLHCFALLGCIWPYLALFGCIWPYLAVFGPSLAVFGPSLAVFGPVSRFRMTKIDNFHGFSISDD